MFIRIALWLAALATLASGQISPSEEYTHSATLRSGNIKLYWKFNDTYITFEVIGQTTGWIGIGFSPNGAMKGSDIIVGWVKNGEVTITDRHGTANAFPPLDPEHNINVLGGSESNGWTMYKFSRELAACEADYDREITQATERLIFAYGDSDPTGDDITARDYHGSSNRGSESMYFLESPNSQSNLPVGPTYKTFDVLADKLELPEEQTYYSCKLFKLPNVTSKHHIVKIEPVIQEGNELNVHHILLNQCGNVLMNENELGVEAPCYTPNMEHFKTCSTIIIGWAIGGSPLFLPEEAGFSIGSEGDPIYVQRETHYDNPDKKSGIIDSSGLRITYTSTLRRYDAAMVPIGARIYGVEHFIPPRTPEFNNIFQCTSNCIEKIMDDAGVDSIKVSTVLLHSHLAGKKLRLRHIRNGTELPYIASDPSYDFNYQETRALDPFVTVEKGDRLQMECVYNTEDRDAITQGGYGTPEEMCLGYIFYYPKLDWDFCISSVSSKLTYPFFGINFNDAEFIEGDPRSLQSYNLTAPPSVAGKTLFEFFNEYNWTTDVVKKFETYRNNALQYNICTPRNRSNQEVFLYAPVPFTPYVESHKACAVTTYTPSTADVTTLEQTIDETTATTSGNKIASGSLTNLLLMGIFLHCFK